MRALAEQEKVPVLSYPELTRAIYFTSREGDEVSEDLYVAVATILAFVFNLDRAIAEGRGKPEIEVPGSMRFDETGAPLASKRPGPKISPASAVSSSDRNIGQQP
jgi:flagellar biosynthetic protein FlhB